jgi:ferredoxin
MALRQRLRWDPTACTGHGLCADLLPERIELDEWGYPVITGDVPPGLARHARRAVRACPALALQLERADGDRNGRAGHRGHRS